MTDSNSNVPRKRRRPAKSCEQCRHRKIRCDQSMPCAACIRARTSLQCSYRPESLDMPRTINTSANANVAVSRDYALTPNSVLRPQSSHATGPPPRSDVTQHEKTIRDLRRQVQHLEAQVALLGQSNQLPTPTDTTTIGSETRPQLKDIPVDSSQHSQISDTFIPTTSPRLRNAPNKTKLFGQSHWLHTAEKLLVVGKFDAMEVEPAFNTAQAELTNAVKEICSLKRTLIRRDSVQITSPLLDLPGTLPQKAVCDELVRSYFRTFDLIYRIIHAPTFWREYDQFWEQPSSTSTPTHFLMKLVLILAIGTTFYPDSGNMDRANLQRLAQQWVYVVQSWLTGPSEKSTATLDGLQVFCLLILARQSTHKCPGGSTWLSTGSLMTMAQTMGLHRNPKIFSSLTPFQIEMRARLWTTVLELVCKSCLDSALPLCISLDDSDAILPSNFDDQDLDPAETTGKLPREGVTDSSIQILLAKSLPLRIKVAHLLNDFRSDQSYQTALNLGAELRTACRDVASFFHASLPRTAHSESALSPTDFHRKFLDIYLRKYILLLHRPFMLQARKDPRFYLARKDPRFYLARKVCVESATIIGSYSSSIDLDNEIVPLDDLSRLSMVGRGVFKGALSLDIILVLALEVITQLEEEGPHHSVPDPLDEINMASRAPLIRILDHISNQLLRIIGMGNASLKRYIFLSAFLSQIRAMESGECVKQVVYETLVADVKKCHSLLQAQVRLIESSNDGVDAMSITNSVMAPLYPLEMDSMDTGMPWDISYLLDFPLLGEEEQTAWIM